MELGVSVARSFFSPGGIPLYGRTTVYLSTHLLMASGSVLVLGYYN